MEKEIELLEKFYREAVSPEDKAHFKNLLDQLIKGGCNDGDIENSVSEKP